MDMNQQGLHLINIGITLAFISKTLSLQNQV